MLRIHQDNAEMLDFAFFGDHEISKPALQTRSLSKQTQCQRELEGSLIERLTKIEDAYYLLPKRSGCAVHLKGANTPDHRSSISALATEASTKHSLAFEKRSSVPFSSFIKASIIESPPVSEFPVSTIKPSTMPQDFWSPLPRWWCGHCNGPYYRGPGGPMTQGLHKHCFNCHRRRDVYSTPPPPAERPRRERERGNGRHD